MIATKTKSINCQTSPERHKILLLHWNGRFGNRMFTYAFLRNYADQFNCEIHLPSQWEGDYLFKNKVHKIIEDDNLRLYLNQTDPVFDNINARWQSICTYNERFGDNIEYMNPDNKNEYGKTNCCIDSLCCYSPHIFGHYSKSKMLEEYFQFSDRVKETDLYKRMEDQQGKYVVAHLRRDDICDPRNRTNTGYSVISKTSYINAFKKFGYDPDKVVWVSDDRTGNWGVPIQKISDNWSYPHGSQFHPELMFSWFPDFLKLVFSKAVFRANSSFSWWAAFFNKGDVYSPRLHTRRLYHETLQELDVEFEYGNHPHWLCVPGLDGCDNIHIPE